MAQGVVSIARAACSEMDCSDQNGGGDGHDMHEVGAAAGGDLVSQVSQKCGRVWHLAVELGA